MKTFNNIKLNDNDEILSTLGKYNRNCDIIHCKETSGHIYDIYVIRKGTIEITVYRDPENPEKVGSEIYYLKENLLDIKYSKNYIDFKNFPKKYLNELKILKEKFNKTFNCRQQYIQPII